jgi:hypothetical protein
MNFPPASVEADIETSQYVCALTYNTLDAQKIISSVQDDAAGAVAVFIGNLLYFQIRRAAAIEKERRGIHFKVRK